MKNEHKYKNTNTNTNCSWQTRKVSPLNIVGGHCERGKRKKWVGIHIRHATHHHFLIFLNIIFNIIILFNIIFIFIYERGKLASTSATPPTISFWSFCFQKLKFFLGFFQLYFRSGARRFYIRLSALLYFFSLWICYLLIISGAQRFKLTLAP